MKGITCSKTQKCENIREFMNKGSTSCPRRRCVSSGKKCLYLKMDWDLFIKEKVIFQFHCTFRIMLSILTKASSQAHLRDLSAIGLRSVCAFSITLILMCVGNEPYFEKHLCGVGRAIFQDLDFIIMQQNLSTFFLSNENWVSFRKSDCLDSFMTLLFLI